MTTYLFLAVTGVIGLGIGIWLGLPGRYSQTQDEIEQRMESGGMVRRPLPKRSVNPLAWLQRKASSRNPSRDRRQGRNSRSRFTLELPDEEK